MAEEANDTSWLDGPAPVLPGVPTPCDDWLNIEDPHVGKTTRAFEALVNACMRGTDRVMACDGHFLAYRPYNREFDKETNPRTRERFADFQAAGFYKHIGTYDEVQIYELEEGSPFRHSQRDYVIGQNYWKDIRTCARAACAREWSDFHDLMGACAKAIKANREPAFAKACWDDFVKHVNVTVQQMKGPSVAEVSAGFARIRQARGISKGSTIVVPSTIASKYESRKSE